MTKYLLLGLGLALASCAAQKALPQLSEEQKRANERGIAYWQPDSASRADTAPHTPKWAVAVPPAKLDSIVVEPHRTLLDKLLGRKPEPYTVGAAPVRVGKKSTVNIFHAPATVTTTTLGKKATGAVGAGATATTIGKAKGPTAVGDSAIATDNTKAGQRGGAAATAPHATATTTTQKSSWPWWAYVLLIGAGGFLIYRGYKALTTI